MDRSSKGNLKIPGTVLNGQHAQLLVSSGIQALDTLLGGGLPVGTVTIIEEDLNGSYAKILVDYFLAEGITGGHSTLIASLDASPYNIIKELPAVIQSDPQPIISSTNTLAGNDMKIAFRYKNLPTSQKVDTTYIGHHYDLAKNMSFKDIENSDILYWDGQRMETVVGMFTNQNYNELLKTIKSKIKDGKFFLKDNSTNSTILRLGVYSLGSPMWLPPRNSFHPMNNSRDLDMFIFCLRALVRSAFAVAVITIPTHLYHKNSLDRCIHSSDIAMRLQAFSGTELENNVNLSEYHGFFHLTKVAAINSFTSKHPGAVEYVFKLRRKKLYIEKLHLPPDIQDTGDKHTGISTECGNSDKRLLEF